MKAFIALILFVALSTFAAEPTRTLVVKTNGVLSDRDTNFFYLNRAAAIAAGIGGSGAGETNSVSAADTSITVTTNGANFAAKVTPGATLNVTSTNSQRATLASSLLNAGQLDVLTNLIFLAFNTTEFAVSSVTNAGKITNTVYLKGTNIATLNINALRYLPNGNAIFDASVAGLEMYDLAHVKRMSFLTDLTLYDQLGGEALVVSADAVTINEEKDLVVGGSIDLSYDLTMHGYALSGAGSISATGAISAATITATKGFIGNVEAPTNVFSGAVFYLGTNSFISTASAVNFTSVGNIASSNERWGQVTIKATADIGVTNPAAWFTSDMASGRIVTNGNTFVIAVDVQPGIFTNAAAVQFKRQ